jgi:subtilisin-like proprotein convertase family protein
MKYYPLSHLLLCSLLLLANLLPAQKPGSNAFFQPFDENSVQLRQFEARPHQPVAYTAWKMDYTQLQTHLLTAPHETARARTGLCNLSVPVSGQAFENFSVWATDIMHPDLQAKFPGIRTFSGISNDGTGNAIRITTSLWGAHISVVRPDMGISYIEPYWWGQTSYYMQFDRSALVGKRLPDFTSPDLKPVELPTVSSTPGVQDRGSLEPVTFRVLRFAITPTKGFVEDHGGTVESCMAALVNYANRTNIAYERDCAMRLQLIANNDKLIGGPGEIEDTGDNAGMAAANRSLTNTRIGFVNYDIGHVFARGGGGVSLGLGIACNGTGKSGGCSAGGGKNDYGDFFVGVVGQETGHQMGGAHTWNYCGAGNSQRSGNSAYEPGSGTTIMSYSGLCGSDNVNPGGGFDLYYHSHSIDQIRGFADEAKCGTATVTTNTKPVVSLNYASGFYIPVRTPFYLQGQATDADGDNLTYCWEQFDKGPEAPLDTPVGNVPIFRTLPPMLETGRYFPRYTSVLNGINSTRTERLPTYTRDLTFRLTVRDNNPQAGGIAFEEVEFKAFEGAGPFLVTAPNAATIRWEMGKFEVVRWSVSNTEKAPVNCTHVNILLSRDGGKTFKDTLAFQTPNDGSQYVLIPKVTEGDRIVSARVKVESVGNIFYDVSNANFTVQKPSTPSYSLSLSNEIADICLPALFETDIAAAGTLGFSEAAVLSVEGDLPPEVQLDLSQNILAPGQNARLVLDMRKLDRRDTIDLTLKATLPNGTVITRPITVRTAPNNFSALKLTVPANGVVGQGLTQVLRWQKARDARTYEVQIATSPAFGASDIKASAANIQVDSFKVPILLAKNTAYYWRVRPTNECGGGAWSDPAFFSTLSENCSVVGANDLPVNISQSIVVNVQSKINVNAVGKVGSLAVKQIKGNHTFFKELTLALVGPEGQEAVLIKNKCANNNISFDFSVTDQAANTFTCVPLPQNGRTYKPETPLSVFNGKNTNGAWTLRINDNTPSSGGGTISAFQLEFCTAIALNPPQSDKNNPLELLAGTNKPITNDLLSTSDPNNTPAQVTYILVTVPKYGHLEKNLGGALKPGDRFTQADIDAGIVRYYNDGVLQPEDYFLFVVTDNEGGFVGTPRFNIRITDVTGTRDLADLSQNFGLYPNPAEGLVWVGLDQLAASDYQVGLFNITGQRVYESILPKGADRLQLPLQNLAAGLYWVRLENETGAGVRKLVVKSNQ